MADYTGTISADVTLETGDTIGISGNTVIASGYTMDATAGAIVSVYATRAFYPAVAADASIELIGTESAPITLQCQSADPDEDASAWSDVRNSTAGNLTLRYVKITNCEYGLNLLVTTGTLDVTKIWAEKCLQVMRTAGNVAPVYTKIFGRDSYGWSLDGNNAAIDVAVSQCWMERMVGHLSFDELGGGTNTLSDCVAKNGLSGSRNFLFQDETEITMSDCWASLGSYGTYCQEANTNVTTIGNVFYKNASYGNYSTSSAVITSSYNDCIGAIVSGLYTNGGTLNSDYDSVAGNNYRPDTLYDVSADTQVGTVTSRTNAQSSPIKPLEVDNIAEGTPTTSAITITFDCAAGTTSKRSTGLPFIKYGTVSGVYDMQSFLPDESLWGLYWIEWYTDMAWASTGHSVTLSNLKDGTTYYYKCCWVDPLGRLAESTEGDFTTASGGTASTAIGLVG